mmetsp:Transcript_18546/g.32881  ORF Transcript_18546/g.32881 Transcript_18546/m.32881 type:complete len:82 (+) Transcript_18546:11-256(+)
MPKWWMESAHTYCCQAATLHSASCVISRTSPCVTMKQFPPILMAMLHNAPRVISGTSPRVTMKLESVTSPKTPPLGSNQPP